MVILVQVNQSILSTFASSFFDGSILFHFHFTIRGSKRLPKRFLLGQYLLGKTGKNIKHYLRSTDTR